jgi:hypothetical protein
MTTRVMQMESDPRLAAGNEVPGMSMIRLEALRAASGLDSSLVASEDREISLRLRRLGWRIARIDADMAIHELDHRTWTTWWRRKVRGGRSIAQLVALHGRSPERVGVRRSISIVLWGVALPLTLLAAMALGGPLCAFGIGVYPAFGAVIYRRMRRLGFGPEDSRAYALLACASKFPEAVGQLQFLWGRLRGRP